MHWKPAGYNCVPTKLEPAQVVTQDGQALSKHEFLTAATICNKQELIYVVRVCLPKTIKINWQWFTNVQYYAFIMVSTVLLVWANAALHKPWRLKCSIPKPAALPLKNRVASPNISELLVYQICIDTSTCLLQDVSSSLLRLTLCPLSICMPRHMQNRNYIPCKNPSVLLRGFFTLGKTSQKNLLYYLSQSSVLWKWNKN